MNPRIPACRAAAMGLALLVSAEAFPARGASPQIIDGRRAADVTADGRVDFDDVDLVSMAAGSPCPRKDLDAGGVVDLADTFIVESFLGQQSTCPADLDGDKRVDGNDRLALEEAFDTECGGDLTRDGSIDELDLAVMDAYLQAAPGSAAHARADLDDDGDVDLGDRVLLIGRYDTDCRPDLNRDAVVDVRDLWSLLAAWGPCTQAGAGAMSPVLTTKGTDCDDVIDIFNE